MSIVSQSARFAERGMDERPDYSGAKPGAFDKSHAKPRAARSSMGGMAARSSVFDPKPQESASNFGAYDGAYERTGAFANVASRGTGVSAAFASKSGRFDRPTGAGSGSATTSYDVNYNTMGASANKSFSKLQGGTFGTSKRETTLGKDFTPRSARSADDTATSDQTAPLRSSFGGPNPRNKGPSAAFGGSKDRFAPAREATPGPGEYTAADARKPLHASRSANAISRGTMGTTDRFAPTKVAAPGDYSDARPSAFASASRSRSRLSNTGFGGTVSRESTFEKQARLAAQNAPSVGNYDGAYTATGAFHSASARSSGPSSGFASKSERLASTVNRSHSEGPAPGAYNSHATSSMASMAAKSFNKSSRLGSGGFGSSMQRIGMPTREACAPGPGEYDASAVSFAKPDTKPSAAFASKSDKSSYVRTSEAPSAGSYDAHAHDGMAAAVTRTFNKNVAAKGGTMGGTASRFAPAREAAPGDFYDPSSSFDASKSGIGHANTGFGGTAKRTTAFDEAASRAVDSAPDTDTSYVVPGAFARASEASGPSSGFASKSLQRAGVESNLETPGAGAYNAHAVGSMASAAAKSFNKQSQSGVGSFGTSSRRSALEACADDFPAPGAYDGASAGGIGKVDAKPSAAFASETKKLDSYVKPAEAPSAYDYDAHSSDSMAARAAKSFNVKAGTGNFGPKVARTTHEIRHTPGAGEYTPSDPTRPTVDRDVNSTRGRVTGPFASTSLRDTSAMWSTK